MRVEKDNWKRMGLIERDLREVIGYSLTLKSPHPHLFLSLENSF